MNKMRRGGEGGGGGEGTGGGGGVRYMSYNQTDDIHTIHERSMINQYSAKEQAY